jgi:hypothetical protein
MSCRLHFDRLFHSIGRWITERAVLIAVNTLVGHVINYTAILRLWSEPWRDNTEVTPRITATLCSML